VIKLPCRFNCAGLRKFLRDLKNVNADVVLFLHEEAEEHPKGSDERLAALELAHEIYLEGRRKRRGRPKKETPDDDAPALAYMQWMSQKTGETRVIELARAVVKLGSVPNVGSEKSQVERLARKYTKRRGTPEFPHGPGWGSSPDDDELIDESGDHLWWPIKK
jgi:hypothetical protein